MLFAHSGAAARETITTPHHAPLTAVWLDLLNPTDAERALAERATGLLVPSRADIEEIESSSRLSMADGVLTLNTPMAFRDAEDLPSVTQLGFVLSDTRLITIRYARLPVFDEPAPMAQAGAQAGAQTGAMTQVGAMTGAGPCSAEVFLRLLEAIVDRLADGLERIGKTLDQLSRGIFHGPERGPQMGAQKGPTPAKKDAAMQQMLRSVGRAGDSVGNIRNALLGVERMAPYVAQMGQDFIPHALQPRFAVLQRDIASLNDYDAQLSTKVNFLLDATLGFINIEQNNGIKVLTIVSIVGIPPTFIASLYGMNFKNIPELQWEWWYPYALALMLATAVVPLVWFKIKGWL